MKSKHCDFIDGICAASRAKNKIWKSCCSRGCLKNKGYYEFSNQEYPEEYDYLFDKDKGFLTTTGCAIPREDRSNVCNTYLCMYIKKLEA